MIAFWLQAVVNHIYNTASESGFNPWRSGGSFMAQKMAIFSLIPTFKGLKH